MTQVLKLPCETGQLAILRQFLDKILKDTTLSATEQLQVILAVEEVAANLIIHSHSCNPEQSIDLQVITGPGQLCFEIKDKGESFNILDYQEPDLEEVIKAKRKGGLGIMLVKKIMDRIEFESNGHQNTCRLIKLLNSK